MGELLTVAEVCKVTSTFEKDTEKFVHDYLSTEEKNNFLLDTILSIQKRLKKINSSYTKLFISFEDLFEIPIDSLNVDDSVLLKDIIKKMKKTNREMFNTYLLLLKNKTISEGCKSVLKDLKINIHSMKETLSDIEEVFIEKKYDSPELKNLLSNF